jgi:MoxR-like ATPase
VACVTGFFGRTHELEVVRAAVARAPGEGRPTAVIVDGEPGVGKSRLISVLRLVRSNVMYSQRDGMPALLPQETFVSTTSSSASER